MSPGLRHGAVVPQVERLLRERVRRGEWAVGQRLPNESALAAELGVGRSSVREAVRLLVHDGVLDVRHGSGTFVVDHTGHGTADVAALVRRARLREVYEVRRALEVEAARLAAARAHPADVDRMAAALERRQALAAADPAEFVDADLEFHRAVVDASGNALLAGLFAAVLPAMREALVAMVTHEERLPDTADPHEALLAAVRAGDADGAVSATRENLRLVTDLIAAETSDDETTDEENRNG